MADSPFIFDIDESNYEQIVIQGSHQVPILVDFWAGWCQPCQVLMPLLAKLADEYQGRFVLAKINTEEQQAIAAQFGIRSIPTVKLFRNGRPVDEFAGALPEAEVRAFLDRHLPRESDNTVSMAEDKLRAGDAAGALALLEQARAADPANPRIGIAIAQVQSSTGDLDAAEATLDALTVEGADADEVERVRSQLFFDRIAGAEADPTGLEGRLQADPGDSEARYRLAGLQAVHGHYEAAMDNLLTLMQNDRKFGEDAARQALLRLFAMLGNEPIVNRYRTRMFNLLH